MKKVTTLRIEEEQYNRLAEIAKEENRSISSQLNYMVHNLIKYNKPKPAVKKKKSA